uniref:Uncharacterized protein n=1 Tax=Spongospora subterranea TaxID=70186 RepID=A0A0H5RAN2_9EUKA|eukprot:CRZ11225.1 hypothetical protein [Spongospora subterranea]
MGRAQVSADILHHYSLVFLNACRRHHSWPPLHVVCKVIHHKLQVPMVVLKPTRGATYWFLEKTLGVFDLTWEKRRNKKKPRPVLAWDIELTDFVLSEWGKIPSPTPEELIRTIQVSNLYQSHMTKKAEAAAIADANQQSEVPGTKQAHPERSFAKAVPSPASKLVWTRIHKAHPI